MALDLEKLDQTPHVLDMLLQMEDVLDSLDLYVFENWLDGAVVDGPNIRRYWVSMTLLYPYKKMPDPRAILRLMKHDVRVDFSKGRRQEGGFEKLDDASGTDAQERQQGQQGQEGEEPTEMVWLVKISFPRRLITDLHAAQLDFYDDEIDIDDVQDAHDDGIDAETSYLDNPDSDVNAEEDKP
jgi:hypothetical protein